MAYLCPVCEEPQVDAEHLANHVAFTAVIRGGNHEAWLDDHLPGWDDNDEGTLAERLLELESIEAVEHPIDDADDGAHEHSNDQNHAPTVDRRAVDRGVGALDGDAQEILAEAQDLTQQMQQADAEGDGDADEDPESPSEGETE